MNRAQMVSYLINVVGMTSGGLEHLDDDELYYFVQISHKNSYGLSDGVIQCEIYNS